MAGHSHWKGIKERKGANDKKRAKVFAKLLRGIEVAARNGDASPENNPALFDAIQRAKSSSVPKDNIERAVARATGQVETETWESVSYEGYAAGGVAVLVDALTDNRNRTGQDVRAIFRKAGGSLAEPGAVKWLFDRRGVIAVSNDQTDEETLMSVALEGGAEDVVAAGSEWEVVTDPTSFEATKAALSEAGISWTDAGVTQRPQNSVPVDGDDAKAVLRLLETLDDHDDVQEVFANYDIPDAIFAEID